jgi:hypothetical protein
MSASVLIALPKTATTTTIPEPERTCPKCERTLRLDTQSHTDAIYYNNDISSWVCPSRLPGHETWQPFRVREPLMVPRKYSWSTTEQEMVVPGPRVAAPCAPCRRSVAGKCVKHGGPNRSERSRLRMRALYVPKPRVKSTQPRRDFVFSHEMVAERRRELARLEPDECGVFKRTFLGRCSAHGGLDRAGRQREYRIRASAKRPAKPCHYCRRAVDPPCSRHGGTPRRERKLQRDQRARRRASERREAP